MTTQEPAPAPTILDRLTAAGIDADRIQQHLAAGRIRVDGQVIEDLDTPAPPTTTWVIGP